MAKTLEEIIFSVWEQAEGFNITDDSPYPEKWIEDLIVSVNETLIREAYMNRRLSAYLYLEESNVPVKDFSEDVVISGITVKNRSAYCYADISPLVTGVGNMDIKYLGGVGYSNPYTRRTLLSMIKGSKAVIWPLGKPIYALTGTKVIFPKSEQLGQVIDILALWADPRMVSTYNSEQPFPTPSDYKLELLSLQQILQSKNVPWDERQDGQRTILVPQKQTKQKDG